MPQAHTQNESAAPTRRRVTKLTLAPACLRWARERARLSIAELAEKPNFSEAGITAWEMDGNITLSQLTRLAQATHTPIGYLFLPEPPEESLPVQDFRTPGTNRIERPSLELLDTVNEALRRQDWYRDYAQSEGLRVAFVGSLNLSADTLQAAEHIRGYVKWDSALRSQAKNWEDALTRQVEAIEAAGILVMRNSVVGNNTSRPLRIDEFRGFALSDDYAPLIFLNGRDAKAAQMFTLAHELVHIFLGESGVSNLKDTYAPNIGVEQFCNRVAAELLAPLAELRVQWEIVKEHEDRIARLGKHFKVSSLVILRRLKDAGAISEEEFRALYAQEWARFTKVKASGGGGNPYLTLKGRLGRRFASAVILSAWEGQTLYRDAFSLLGVKNSEAMKELAKAVKVIP